MATYYNEIDAYAAQWLRNLIAAGHIAAGDVDERSIVDVKADDLRGYTQCHFFAGIGGWSIALRLAGWPDDRPVWTGSCPCQPFSAAGAGKAADDERHLWPAWFPLIRELCPATVFGEQVEAAVGWGWLDAVFADLEGEGYACGATVLPACGVGAPHIRQRLWFVADAAESRRQTARQHDGGQSQLPARPAEHGGVSVMANTDKLGTEPSVSEPGRTRQEERKVPIGHSVPSRNQDAAWSHAEQFQATAWGMGHTSGQGLQERERDGRVQREAVGPQPRETIERGSNACPLNGFWSDAEWIACTDGKARPVGPGSFPLGHGIQRRASKLRAYGNAIVPQVAAELIKAVCSETNS